MAESLRLDLCRSPTHESVSAPHPPVIVPSTAGLSRALVALATAILGVIASFGDEARSVEGHVLRPRWEIGKCYHLQQRLEARTSVIGFGKHVVDWRQHLSVTPRKVEGGERLEIAIKDVRADLNLSGRRSRYYFRPGEPRPAEPPTEDEDEPSIRASLLKHIQSLVDCRYRLDLTAKGDVGLEVVPINARPAPAASQPSENHDDAFDWSCLPWKAITTAVLHQGIPDAPLQPGDRWKHHHQMPVAPHGVIEVDLSGKFRGIKEIKGQELALIEFKGSLAGVFQEDATVEGSPGVDLKAPTVKGLTLIHPVERTIMSTVVKIDGKLTSLGLPGTEIGETAPLKKTLTLTLLSVEDVPVK